MNKIDACIIARLEKKYGVNFYALLQRKKVAQFIHRYIDSAHVKFVETKKLDVENVIWMYWDDPGQIPNLINVCVDSVKRNTKCQVLMLSERNFDEFITLPRTVLDKYNAGKITKTHFSDILRVALLARYGGTWIDATVFCTAEIPTKYLNTDFFLFQKGPWGMYDFEWQIPCSSWFMTAKKGLPFMLQLQSSLFAYWEHENVLRDYFLLHLFMREISGTRREYIELWRRMPFADTQLPHYLSSVMGREFDEAEWENIKRLSPIHKLSYKNKFNNMDCFYKKLVRGEIR